jgi:hypothetical protein
VLLEVGERSVGVGVPPTGKVPPASLPGRNDSSKLAARERL